MGYKFKNVCLIYPTAICTDIWHLKKAKSMIKREKNLDYVFFAKEYEHPIERAFYLKKELTKAINFNGLNRRSQDLKKKYYDAGQFYYGPKILFRKKIPMNSRSSIIVDYTKYISDIDYNYQWKILEKIYNKN